MPTSLADSQVSEGYEMRSSNVDLGELRDRISWLILLRWLAILGVLVTIWVARRVLGIELRQFPLYLLAGILAAQRPHSEICLAGVSQPAQRQLFQPECTLWWI